MESKEIEKIKAETKELLDKFSKALEKVKTNEGDSTTKEEDRRKEQEGVDSEKEFREIMFDNSKNKDEDFIIAEKKSW